MSHVTRTPSEHNHTRATPTLTTDNNKRREPTQPTAYGSDFCPPRGRRNRGRLPCAGLLAAKKGLGVVEGGSRTLPRTAAEHNPGFTHHRYPDSKLNICRNEMHKTFSWRNSYSRAVSSRGSREAGKTPTTSKSRVCAVILSPPDVIGSARPRPATAYLSSCF